MSVSGGGLETRLVCELIGCTMALEEADINRVMKPGDCVRVGRNTACEIVVRSPNISGLHCVVEIRSQSVINKEPVQCSVRDLSSNGTWLLLKKDLGEISKARKLSKGSKEDLHLGDHILLLAPSQSSCKQFHFTLMEGPTSSEYIFEQLPPSLESERDHSMEASASNKLKHWKSNTATTTSIAGLKPTMRKCSPSNGCSMPISGDFSKSDSSGSLESPVAGDKRKLEDRVDVEETKGTKNLKVSIPASKERSTSLSSHKETTANSEPKIPVKPTLKREVSMGRCPICLKLFPVTDLPIHSAACQERRKDNTGDTKRDMVKATESEGETDGFMVSGATVGGGEKKDVVVMSEDTRSEATEDEGGKHAIVISDTTTSEEDVKLLPHHKIPKLEVVASHMDTILEQCPTCLKIFPLNELIAHSESCYGDSKGKSSTPKLGPALVPDIADSKPPASHIPTPTRDTSIEQCPNCFKIFPINELIGHSEFCVAEEESAETPFGSLDETDGRKYDLEPCSSTTALRRAVLRPTDSLPEPSTSGAALVPTTLGATLEPSSSAASLLPSTSGVALVPSTCRELEQCVYCLKDYPVEELIAHVSSCPMKDKNKCTIEEHCQHCLKVFPLDELVAHAFNCSQRKQLGSLESEMADGVMGSQDLWGEPVERCMHCFKDFPLSVIVKHSTRCMGELSGPRERLKGFLPSIHDLDPMALAVLNDTQMSAVEHVLKVSKKATERLLPSLKAKVLRLGYTEKDLESALQWVRREAPIIIHVRLDSVLGFLVKDTHYRNQFETRTSGGCTDLRARRSWEDRIFNKVYARSPPVDRVKYGVLNIVGDPRGVRSCYSYGDSFLQLKKVRLRTTFASEDTSSGAVVLSCCEYYSNVMFKYTDLELRAILDVATRKKSYLRSDIIFTYKEIQIHGPVCLLENVDCIVVNDRHSGDPEIGRLLDLFVERNKCNLIWMEPESGITYPTFDALPASTGLGTTSAFSLVPVAAPRRLRRRHRRRGGRRRRRTRHHYEDGDDYSDEEDSEEDYDDY